MQVISSMVWPPYPIRKAPYIQHIWSWMEPKAGRTLRRKNRILLKVSKISFEVASQSILSQNITSSLQALLLIQFSTYDGNQKSLCQRSCNSYCDFLREVAPWHHWYSRQNIPAVTENKSLITDPYPISLYKKVIWRSCKITLKPNSKFN
jgi:hypothetical protein